MWLKCEAKGRRDFILFEKLKFLKSSLRIWNKEVFGWIDLKVEESVEELNALNKLLVENTGSNSVLLAEERLKVVTDFWKHLDIKESYLRQKSRQTWLKEGDRNTSYFHNALKIHNRRNFINSVKTPFGVVETVEEVKKAVHDHFASFLKESNSSRSVPEDRIFNRLNAHERDMLEDLFTESEVKAAIWSCDEGKRAGPNGFSFDFLKKS